MRKKIIHSLALIASTLETYKNIALACSFGKDSMVTLHLCRQINPDIKVMEISTPYWFKETQSYSSDMRSLWGLNIQWYQQYTHKNNKTLLEKQQELHEISIDECCDYYKVEPLRSMIKELDLDAWISGLRRTEGTEHRKFTKEIEERDGLVKINPILEWREAEVWLYHAMHNIPIHPLYTKGYRSIGCEPCSLPYTKEERGGRWAGSQKSECGIHTKSLK